MATASPARLLSALGLSSALAPLNSTMLVVAVPAIARALGEPVDLVTHALVTSYLVGSVVLQSPGGKFGDRIGHRRALRVGQVVLGAGALLAFFGPTLLWLASARFLMAVGGAIIVPAAAALIRLDVPLERRARAFGAFGATMALAATVGPIVGGVLEHQFGYRALFLVNLPVLLLTAALAGGDLGPRPSGAEKRAGFDVAGTLLLALALGTLVVGSKLSGGPRLALVAAGGALLVPFVLWERRAADPVVDPGLFRSPVFSAGGLLIALHNLGMYALMFEIANVLQRVFELSSLQTGKVMVALMIPMVLASPVSGRLADRLGARALAVTGSLVAVAGIVLLRLTPLNAPTDVVPGLALLGFGLGIAASPAQSSAMSAAPREHSGAAGGVLSMLRYLGGVAGLLVLAVLAHGGAGRQAAIDELHAAMSPFIIALLLAVPCAAMLPGRVDPSNRSFD